MLPQYSVPPFQALHLLFQNVRFRFQNSSISTRNVLMDIVNLGMIFQLKCEKIAIPMKVTPGKTVGKMPQFIVNSIKTSVVNGLKLMEFHIIRREKSKH